MIRYLAIFAVLAVAAPPARAADARPQAVDDSLDAVLSDIDQRAGHAADLTGRFRQEKFTALLKKPLVSEGRIRMKGPVVRWDTESPDPGVLYSDGREIKVYYPKQSTVEIYPIDRRLSDLAASPLPRLAALRQHFRIKPLKSATDRSAPLEISLTPTDEYLAQHVDEVRVTLDVAAARVTRVEILDADGDRTLIRFTDVRTDTGIKDHELDLSLPPNTKVSRPLDGAQGGGTK
jgi:outer membrane lipoprotein-sorting protein